MIYHNGWWHGNNAAFIRLIQDSATIIVLGNKENHAIYHAKDLSNIFGNYFDDGGDDEASRTVLLLLIDGEAEVDRGKHIVDTLGVLLDPARMEHHSRRRGSRTTTRYEHSDRSFLLVVRSERSQFET